MSFKTQKFLDGNPRLVKIIGEEFLEGSSVTEILQHHPELENKRQRVYDALDMQNIARRRRPIDYDIRFEDIVKTVRNR